MTTQQDRADWLRVGSKLLVLKSRLASGSLRDSGEHGVSAQTIIDEAMAIVRSHTS